MLVLVSLVGKVGALWSLSEVAITCRGGMDPWREVLQRWKTYRAWALRIVGACGLLAECVSAEQAAEQMARGLPATPSLFGAARLAFRSQV